DGFCTYSGLIIATLFCAVARAAPDDRRFTRCSDRPVVAPGSLKDRHRNLLFGKWIEALKFGDQLPKVLNAKPKCSEILQNPLIFDHVHRPRLRSICPR